MPVVKFIKENKEIEVPEGTNLRRAAIDAGVNVYQGVNGYLESINKSVIGNCHGLGLCGTCRVAITSGMENTSPMGLMEKMKLTLMGFAIQVSVKSLLMKMRIIFGILVKNF